MFKLTSADAGDIAITAAEGGVGYWCKTDNYDWHRWVKDVGDPGRPANAYPQPEYDGNVDVPRDFVFYTLYEMDNPFVGHDVTPEVIERGVNLFLNGVPGNFEGRFFADPDLTLMDALEADCVVQLGLFGRLVYG